MFSCDWRWLNLVQLQTQRSCNFSPGTSGRTRRNQKKVLEDWYHLNVEEPAGLWLDLLEVVCRALVTQGVLASWSVSLVNRSVFWYLHIHLGLQTLQLQNLARFRSSLSEQ